LWKEESRKREIVSKFPLFPARNALELVVKNWVLDEGQQIRLEDDWKQAVRTKKEY